MNLFDLRTELDGFVQFLCVAERVYYLYLIQSLESQKNQSVVKMYQSAVLQGMIDRLLEIGRCCGMEMNVEEN